MGDNSEHISGAGHFKISAAVVKQLGEELVTDEVTAFMELVKNSYDADSTWVTIDINTENKSSNPHLLTPVEVTAHTLNQTPLPEEEKTQKQKEDDTAANAKVGYISIKDNGTGMSLTDIIDRWMTISLSRKRGLARSGKTTDRGRTNLGEKGVGRLSTQRLGSIIDLITGVKGEDHSAHLYFDWNVFDETVTLEEVTPGFQVISKPVSESGTEIIIRNLKALDTWQGESYSRILGQLSQLIFPKANTPGGFKINIKKNNNVQDILDINKHLEKAFVSSFEFSFKEGVLTISGTVMTKKLYGSSDENHDNYNRYIVPDNGRDFVSYLKNSVKNKKDFLSNITYSGLEGVLFTSTQEFPISDISKLSHVEKRDENDNLILDEKGMLIYEIADPGVFSGKINDFSFARDFGQILDTEANLRTVIQNQTGVRIYRDGFGLKPYGLNSQDWLKLGSGNTKGGSFYGLKPFNVVGYVEIGAKQNYNLREKTDREGFIESPYSNNFFRINEYVVKQINLLLEKTRRGLTSYIDAVAAENSGIHSVESAFENLNATAASSRTVEHRMAEVSVRLANAKERIADINKAEDNTTDVAKLKEKIALLDGILQDSNLLVEEIKSILQETTQLDKYVAILKPQIESLKIQLDEFTDLAGLGLTAEALSHELSNITDKLSEETTRIINRYSKKLPSEFFEINAYLEAVKGSVASFRKQLSHLDPALKYVRESRDVFTLSSFFQDIVEFYQSRFGSEIGITLKDGTNGQKIKVNKGKLTQIIDNIILNAEYWLRDYQKQHPGFKPNITIELAPPYIRISDNGNGISESIEDTLFQPFVSLKPKGVGRGLGLFIVQQFLDSIGCSIVLLPERNQNKRRFIFQLYINSLMAN